MMKYELLSPDEILVKSIRTNKVEAIPRPSIELRTDLRLSKSLVYDERITSKIITLTARKGL